MTNRRFRIVNEDATTLSPDWYHIFICSLQLTTAFFNTWDNVSEWVSEWYWFLNVTCNDILVINVTVHKCAGGLKKFDLRSGSQRHRYFVGFFNVPVQAPTRGQPLYGYSKKLSRFRHLLRQWWGCGGHILVLTPGPHRGLGITWLQVEIVGIKRSKHHHGITWFQVEIQSTWNKAIQTPSKWSRFRSLEE